MMIKSKLVVGVVLLFILASPVPAQLQEWYDGLRITYLVSKSDHLPDSRTVPYHVVEYESTTDSMRLADAEYTPEMRYRYCGDPDDRGVYENPMDYSRCPELADILHGYNQDSFNPELEWRKDCLPEKGLMIACLALMSEITQGSVVCYAIVVLDETRDTVVFVDSADYRTNSGQWRDFGGGTLGPEGEYLYYYKDGQAMSYEIGTGRIDTIPGVSRIFFATGNMVKLTYFEPEDRLCVVDENWLPVTCMSGVESKIHQVYGVNDSVFVVARHDLRRDGRTLWVPTIYDFGQQKRHELFKGRVEEIISVEWIE